MRLCVSPLFGGETQDIEKGDSPNEAGVAARCPTEAPVCARVSTDDQSGRRYASFAPRGPGKGGYCLSLITWFHPLRKECVLRCMSGPLCGRVPGQHSHIRAVSAAVGAA
jgi:hypothetical protein